MSDESMSSNRVIIIFTKQTHKMVDDTTAWNPKDQTDYDGGSDNVIFQYSTLK